MADFCIPSVSFQAVLSTWNPQGNDNNDKCFFVLISMSCFIKLFISKTVSNLFLSFSVCLSLCVSTSIRERDKPTCVPEVRKLGSDLTSRTPSPPPTVIRRPKASKRRREVEYSSFICLEPDMASTPGPGDSSGRKERTTSNTIRERDKPTCVPEVRKLGSDLTSRTPSPPPTVIRRPKASKRRREVEYSSFICLEPDMASTPGPGDSSGRKERTTSNTEDKPIAARLRSRKKLSQQPMNN
ncbi:unnamed protein product [Trichobilharzia szidati]|nr:unnamed protein product [Trichobilharzia szidati]